MRSNKTKVWIGPSGRMASAYSLCLQSKGINVISDEKAADIILLSSFSGIQSYKILCGMEIRKGCLVVDLTTQSIPHLEAVEDLVRRAGIHYFAGGVTGGAGQVGSSEFRVLLGPTVNIESLRAIIEKIGSVIHFSTAKQAVAAKLLHNFYLIVSSHTMGAVSSTAKSLGIDVKQMFLVLDTGTAGRKPSSSSVARDQLCIPQSSYTSSLVAKDWNAIKESFQVLGINLFDDKVISSLHENAGSQPYTLTLMKYWTDLYES